MNLEEIKVGTKIGKLTIQSSYEEIIRGNKYYFWKCICECGNQHSVNKKNIKLIKELSCWDCALALREERERLKRNKLIGSKIGQLTILESFVKKVGKVYKYYYKCLCDCGSLKKLGLML